MFPTYTKIPTLRALSILHHHYNNQRANAVTKIIAAYCENHMKHTPKNHVGREMIRMFTLAFVRRKNLPLGCHVWPDYKGCLVPSLEASPGRRTIAPANSLRRWQPPVCSVWNANSLSVSDIWCGRLPPLICRPFLTPLIHFSSRSKNLHKRAQ